MAEITEVHRELAKVADEIAEAVDEWPPGDCDEFWCEELIPPMTDDPDEVVEGMTVTRSDGYDHKGPMVGFTLWRDQVAYRVIVSKLHP